MIFANPSTGHACEGAIIHPEYTLQFPTAEEYRAWHTSAFGPIPDPPPPPEPEELDYPIAKDTIVYRMKMAGKLGVLMGFTKSLPALLQYEFEQSAWFERSTWAQYVVHFGLTEEETEALLAPDETTGT